MVAVLCCSLLDLVIELCQQVAGMTTALGFFLLASFALAHHTLLGSLVVPLIPIDNLIDLLDVSSGGQLNHRRDSPSLHLR